MKDESGDERRGYLPLLLICLCFHRVNGFAGRCPTRSAEVLAAWHGGSVGRVSALIRVQHRFEVSFDRPLLE